MGCSRLRRQQRHAAASHSSHAKAQIQAPRGRLRPSRWRRGKAYASFQLEAPRRQLKQRQQTPWQQTPWQQTQWQQTVTPWQQTPWQRWPSQRRKQTRSGNERCGQSAWTGGAGELDCEGWASRGRGSAAPRPRSRRRVAARHARGAWRFGVFLAVATGEGRAVQTRASARAWPPPPLSFGRRCWPPWHPPTPSAVSCPAFATAPTPAPAPPPAPRARAQRHAAAPPASTTA
mmetsp:Transcript_28636/g.92933  ORF Transcript_28636/g.92933 Transcript_28636/m.92933 type:complete len:232 (+) Transcript_28636:2231-2926(+)